MAYILHIDTTSGHALVALGNDGTLISLRRNDELSRHAAFLHGAIRDMMEEAGISLQDLDAIAVSAGPGSYTGLRVGLATAKGLCYALNKPMIMINTLEIMAHAARELVEDEKEFFLVPMIDARRMEVFTAGYDEKLRVVFQPQALILSNDSYASLMDDRRTFFFGSGMKKYAEINMHANAAYLPETDIVVSFLHNAISRYNSSEFSNLHHSEPLYLKAFQDNR
jgi:tRNA threonylcarbamoyladenosine biosynthesis protein TsaB